MNMENLIEENAKEPREIDYDLKQILAISGVAKEDVANVLAAVYGENDGANWHYIVAMKSGDYAYLEGGCDYTGWGCQDYGNLVKRGTLDEVVAEVPEEERYYKRGNLRNHIKLQLAHEMPFGVVQHPPTTPPEGT